MKRKTAKNTRNKPLSSYPAQMGVRQAADYLNCADDLVRELCESGRLPSVDMRSPGSKFSYFRISRDDLADFERRNKS
jgi:excisionase family DNA binding protein